MEAYIHLYTPGYTTQGGMYTCYPSGYTTQGGIYTGRHTLVGRHIYREVYPGREALGSLVTVIPCYGRLSGASRENPSRFTVGQYSHLWRIKQEKRVYPPYHPGY